MYTSAPSMYRFPFQRNSLVCILLGSLFFITSCNKDKYTEPTPGPHVGAWSVMPALQTPHALYSLAFIDSLQGYAVGDSGIVARTTDGGEHWNVQYLFPGRQLYRILFRNASNGWICGSSGFLAVTQDGGNTWTPTSTGSQATFRDIFFQDTYGWVVGSLEEDTTAAIWRTADNGATWKRQFAPVSHMLQSVYFKDSLGWAVGFKGSIIRSTDGGNHWLSVVSPTTLTLHDISFSSPLLGFICGEDGSMLRTTNGGNSWALLPAATFYDLHDIFFLTEETGWIAGAGGKLLKTINGGQTWLPENTQTSASLYQVQFFPGVPGYAIGTATGPKGIILKYR